MSIGNLPESLSQAMLVGCNLRREIGRGLFTVFDVIRHIIARYGIVIVYRIVCRNRISYYSTLRNVINMPYYLHINCNRNLETWTHNIRNNRH